MMGFGRLKAFMFIWFSVLFDAKQDLLENSNQTN